MGKNGGRGRGGQKWNRKRKAEERNNKAGKARTDGATWDGYNAVKTSNPKMEAYYSLMGLHDVRYERENGFVACTTDEEKTAERELFMSTLRTILPASFRMDRSLDPTI